MCNVGNIEELYAEITSRLQSPDGDIEGVVALLEEHVGLGKLVAPHAAGAWQVLKTALGELFRHEHGRLHQASTLTVWFYHHICEQQKESGERFHKGSTTYQAGIISLQLRQPHEALWFIVLAFIEDVLSNLDNTGHALKAPAARTLRTTFNVPSKALVSMADEVRSRHSLGDNLWHYPETIAVHLELHDLLPMPLAIGTSEIPLNPHLVSYLRERLEEDGVPSQEKGDRLEYLAAYLLRTLPGARVVSKSKAPDHEVDLIITQRTPYNSYLLDVLGRALIVECKNWDTPVGVDALNHFVSKMRFHRSSCGILFSRRGISGEGAKGDVRFAQLTQLRWFHQDGCAVLVVDGDDIGSLLERATSFGELLLDKYEHLRFRQMNAIG